MIHGKDAKNSMEHPFFRASFWHRFQRSVNSDRCLSFALCCSLQQSHSSSLSPLVGLFVFPPNLTLFGAETSEPLQPFSVIYCFVTCHHICISETCCGWLSLDTCVECIHYAIQTTDCESRAPRFLPSFKFVHTYAVKLLTGPSLGGFQSY